MAQTRGHLPRWLRLVALASGVLTGYSLLIGLYFGFG